MIRVSDVEAVKRLRDEVHTMVGKDVKYLTRKQTGRKPWWKLCVNCGDPVAGCLCWRCLRVFLVTSVIAALIARVLG